MQLQTILTIIMLSVIFSLYIRYTTILAYCTDICVISLIHVYAAPQGGIEPRASRLQIWSATDWAMQALEHFLFKDEYELNDVSNDVI